MKYALISIDKVETEISDKHEAYTTLLCNLDAIQKRSEHTTVGHSGVLLIQLHNDYETFARIILKLKESRFSYSVKFLNDD